MIERINPGVKSTERTPLLERRETGESEKKSRWQAVSVVHRILLCAFMVSLSFGVTQVPQV